MKHHITRCANSIKKANLDALLVSDPSNIGFLTGLKQTNGYLLITANKEVFCFTNFLYADLARKKINGKVISSDFDRNIFNLIVDKSADLKLKKIGFEAKSLPTLEFQTLKSLLAEEEINFVRTRDLIERLRMIKTVQEISRIKKAIQISKEAFGYIEEINSGEMSEKALAVEVEKYLRLKGDNEIAFETIVASGKNTAFPHHQPSSDKLANKFFLIDLGAKYCDYCSDLTRLFSWDKMPSIFQKIYNTIRTAQELSIKEIRDGVPAAKIDLAARRYIESKGWGKCFGHGTGHGIGYSVHEPPIIAPKSQDILKEGMVITIEPAIYINNRFGVRLEDMVLVKQKKGEILSGDINR